MVIKFLKSNRILILILFLSAFLHLFRLDYPNAYVFDEVYHGFTAKEYLKGSREAWLWDSVPPAGVAFEWTHPPLAKEIMTASMFLVSSTDAWGWRLPGAILGIISVLLVYKIGKRLFDINTGLIAAFIFSLDGLNFVQSRTGMNDIYLVTFSLASILLLLNKKFFLSAVFLGFAFASKWSAAYLVALNSLIIFYFFINGKFRFVGVIRSFLYILVLVPLIYLFTYIPFFILENNSNGFFINPKSFSQFVNLDALFQCQLYKSPQFFQDGVFNCPFPYTLQNQMLNYHTHLVATHDYASPAWSWPLNLYPVWYYVEYHKNGLISNIFASGNPILFWLGVGAILITIYDFILTLRKRNDPEHYSAIEKDHPLKLSPKDSYLLLLLGFFVFWLPWIFSPRIMFLYHYSPSVPFLSLALGHQISLITNHKSSKWLGIIILLLISLGFLIIYPILTGIPLNKEIFMKFFDTNLAKNPFQ